MAFKSVYEIEVDDSGFAAFKQKYDAYQKQVAGVQSKWQDIEAQTKAISLNLKRMAKTTEKVSPKKWFDMSKQVAQFSQAASVSWGLIKSSSLNVLKNLERGTSNLLKWGTITALVGGPLGTATGLYGIDRLANTVLQQRRTAMGQGLSYGASASANTNLSQISQPGSMLGNLAQVRFNQYSDQRQALVNMGISQELIAKGGPELTDAYLVKLRELAQSTPESQTVPYLMNTLKVGSISSLEEVNQYRGVSKSEFDDVRKRAREQAASIDPGSDAARTWARFYIGLQNARDVIEAVFVKALTPLIEPLSKLKDAVLNAFSYLADQGIIKEWVESFASGIEWLAKNIDTDAFRERIESFVEGVGAIAESIGRFVIEWAPKGADFLDKITGAPGDSGAGGASPYGGLSSSPGAYTGATPGTGLAGSGTGGDPTGAGVSSTPTGNSEAWIKGNLPPAAQEILANANQGKYPNTIAGGRAFIRDIAPTLGVHPDYADSVASHEGLSPIARGKNWGSITDVDSAGNSTSFGHYQNFMNGGVGNQMMSNGIDPRDPNQQFTADAYDIWLMAHGGRGNWNRDVGDTAWGNNSILVPPSSRVPPPPSGRRPTILIQPNIGASAINHAAIISAPTVFPMSVN